MDAFLNIKYKQVSVSDNFEDFLKHNGVNVLLRKVALASSPVTVLTKEGNVYTLTMTIPVKTMKSVFRLGEEFEEERNDGSKVKTVITAEGTKLTQVQTDAAGAKLFNDREYSPHKMVMTTTIDGWNGVVTRYFERID